VARVQFGRAIRLMPPVYEMLANMRLRIEAARALTYRAAWVVEILKGLQRRVQAGAATPEQTQEARLLVRLAAAVTPLAKYYASETANRVASDAIQVLGGSGYMRDYPVERHFRDARITNIYEGTSQLQVVGAIGGITSGVLCAHLDELLAQALAGPARDLAEQVKALRPKLDEAVAVHKKGDQDFRELYARRVVDLALEVYLATLLLLQVPNSPERKRAVAEAFLGEMRPRALENAAAVLEGSRLLIEKHRTIIGG
jgi:hypothetical protein